jgi:hypothetical protein
MANISARAASDAVSDDAFVGCVSCEDVVPLAWRARSSALSTGELHRLQELTLRALRAEPADETDVDDKNLLRLHEKLDSLMEMVGRLLSVHQPTPTPANINLSRRGLAWAMNPADAPSIGQIGVIELHLHPRLLQPLLLPSRVYALRERDGMMEVRVLFEPLSEVVESALERHVFRRHRRSIAETRSGHNILPAAPER